MSELNRKRTLLLGTISNYGAIGVSIVVGLASVPLGLHYFGSVRYGIWLVIGSILAYLRVSDFGVGLSTLTLMAQTSDPAHQRVILRRSIGLLLGASVIFIVLILIISHLFPGWVGILGKVPSNIQGEAATAALAIGILVLLQLPTTVFAAAFSGLQQVHWNRAYGALRSIISLSALVATILVGGSLITLAILTGLGGLLVGIVSGVHLFVAHPNVRPKVTDKVADAPSSNLLFTSGVRFFALQMSTLIIMNTDNLVISHYLGPEKVTPYAVTFRLFWMGALMINAVTSTLWPMYGQALGRGNWEWIQRTYNRCVSALVTVGGLVWIGGIIFSKGIINLWAGPAAYGGFTVAFALGGYAYVNSFFGSNAAIINGLNPSAIVVAFSFVEAILNIGISLALVGLLGIRGIALGTFIACLAVNTWFGPLYIRQRTKGKVKLSIHPTVRHALVAVAPCVILAVLVSLYLSTEWMRLTAGVAIIGVYAVLSWRLFPLDLQNLLKDTFMNLRVYLSRLQQF